MAKTRTKRIKRFEFVIRTPFFSLSFSFFSPHILSRETVYRSIFSTFATAAADIAQIHFNSVEQEKLHDAFFSSLPSYNEHTSLSHSLYHYRRSCSRRSFTLSDTHVRSLSRTSVFHDGLILGTQYRMCHIKRYIIFTPVSL